MSVRRNVAGLKHVKTIGMAIFMSAALTSGSFVEGAKADQIVKLVESLNKIDVLKAPEVVREIEAMGADAVPSLMSLMDDSDPALRHQSIEILGRIGEDANAAIPNLVDALTDSEAQIRRNAAWALGRIGDDAADAMPALMDTAKDIQWDIRADAVWAMGRVVEDSGEWSAVDGELVQTVTDFLKDESHHVRWSAAWSLARLGPGAEASLQQLLDTLTDHHPKVRASAAAALGRVGASHHEDMVKDALSKAMNDESNLVRTRAEAALNAIRRRTAPSF